MTIALTESQLALCEWRPDEHDGWTCDLGPLELRVVYEWRAISWEVTWLPDNYEHGTCASVDDGKRQAIACAARVALELVAMVHELGRRT